MVEEAEEEAVVISDCNFSKRKHRPRLFTKFSLSHLVANSIKEQKVKTVEWSVVYGGFDPFKCEDDDGNTPMQVACRGGYNLSLQAMVDYLKRNRQRQQLEQLDNDGYTPLMISAIHGHVKCVEVLLRAEAKVATKSAAGKTAQELASANKQVAGNSAFAHCY